MLNLSLDSFEKVTMKRVTNKIEYKNPDQLLEYWKNTTFYSVGKDKQVLDKSLEIYPNQLTVTKSIAYLEGSYCK